MPRTRSPATAALTGLLMTVLGCTTAGCTASDVVSSAHGGSGAGQSFEVDLDLSWEPDQLGEAPTMNLPTRQRLTLIIDRTNPRAPTLTSAGGDGKPVTLTLTEAAQGSLVFTNHDPRLVDQRRTEFEIALLPAATGKCFSLRSVSFSHLTLQVSGDTVTGHGTGFGSYSYTDYLAMLRFTATLTGARDRTGPSLVDSRGREIAMNPFDGLTFRFNEVLAHDVRMTLDDGPIAYGLDSAPGSSRFMMDLLLPFGRRLHLNVGPAFRDPAGNRGADPAVFVTTAALAGPFDGFAGQVRATLAGDARIVDGATVTALGARKALLLDGGHAAGTAAGPDGGHFLARLDLPAGASAIVVSTRILSGADGLGWPQVQASAARMGAAIETMQPQFAPIDLASAVPSGVPAFPLLGPVRTTRHPLPAGTGNAVFVEFRSDRESCGPSPAQVPSLIESIAIE